MLVLAIDTVTLAGSAALYQDGLLASCFLHTKKTHSERLLPMIDFLLQSIDLTLKDIDLITVVNGPGSFTGIRIGVTTAKTLAQMLHKPLAAVNTLEVLAANIASEKDLICPVLDARKKEVYTACYKRDENGELLELLEPAALPVQKLLEFLQDRDEDIWFVGDGLGVYGEELGAALGRRFKMAPDHLKLPNAAAAAELGLKTWHKGLQQGTVEPLYLRRSEAEIAWEKKHG